MAAANPLIQAVGAAIARRLENGSRFGAGIGAVVGALIGGAAIWLLIAPAFVVGGIFAGGLIGAWIGCAIGPANRAEPRVHDGRLRFTNYNVAAVPLIVGFFFLVLTVALLVFAVRKTPFAMDDLAYIGGCVVAVAIAAFIASQQVFWIEIGDQVVVRKLLRRVVVPIHDLKSWMLESEPRREWTGTGSAWLSLQMPGVRDVRVQVTAEQAAWLSNVLKPTA